MTDNPHADADTNNRPALRISLLGGMEIEARGQVFRPEWRLRKAAGIIKILALSPQHSLHRDQMLDRLWPDSPADTALNNFYQALYVARRTIGDILVPDAPASLLRLSNQIVSLAPPDGVWVDVDAFERAADRARATDDLADHYAALKIYRGELLPEDLYEGWTESRRQQLTETYLNLLLNLAAIHIEQGDDQIAIDLYLHVIEREPGLEHAHLQLISLYAQLGRPRQALRQFDRLSRAVRREYDADPSDAAVQLRIAIEQGLSDEAAFAQSFGSQYRDDGAIRSPPPRPESLFVGREKEMATLTGCLNQIHQGLHIVAIEGDAGMGKTQIAREIERIADALGIPVFWGHCFEWEGTVAYWPWVEVVRDLLALLDDDALQASLGAYAPAISRIVPEIVERRPETATLPFASPDQARLQLFESVARILRACSMLHPLVIILDDFHWADQSSLLLLEFIAREIQDAPLLVCVTYRGENTNPGNRELSRLIANLARSGSKNSQIELQPLSSAEVSTLIELMTGIKPPQLLMHEIQVTAEGNPFFVTEIVRMFMAESHVPSQYGGAYWDLTIPTSVQDVISRRLDPLPDDVRHLLQAAAVIGRDFDMGLLTAVVDLPASQILDQLDVAVQMHIVDPQEVVGRYRFSHALIQQTLYTQQASAARMRLHHHVGSTIEQLHGANLDAQYGELAWHFANAATLGSVDKAIEYSICAGKQAMIQVAWETALRHFERAYHAHEVSGVRNDALECEILLALGEAQDRVGVGRGGTAGPGNDPVAISTYRTVARIARSANLPGMLAQAALGVAGLSLGGQHGGDEGTLLMQEALDALPATDSELRVQLLARLARGLHLGSVLDGHPLPPDLRAQILTWSNDAISMARRLNDPRTLVEALAAKPVTYSGPLSEIDNTLAALEEALQLSTTTGNLELKAWGLFAKHEALVQKGETGIGRMLLDELEITAARTRMPVYRWFGTVARTGDALRRGRCNDAERYIRQSNAIWPNSNMAAWQEFTLRREQDRLDDVRELHHKRFRAQNIPQNRSYWLVCLVESGQFTDAMALLRIIAESDLDTLPPTTTWLRSLSLIAEACHALEHQEYASRLYKLLAPYAMHNLTLGYTDATGGSISHYLGLLATCNEHWEAAESHFTQALELHNAWDMPPYVAHSSFAYASMLQRRNRKEDRARRHGLTEDALAIAVQLDMEALKQRVRSMQLNLHSA